MPEKNKGRSKFAEEMLGKEIACITCHDPHVGKSKQLFAFGASAEFELCINCHPK